MISPLLQKKKNPLQNSVADARGETANISTETRASAARVASMAGTARPGTQRVLPVPNPAPFIRLLPKTGGPGRGASRDSRFVQKIRNSEFNSWGDLRAAWGRSWKESAFPYSNEKCRGLDLNCGAW